MEWRGKSGFAEAPTWSRLQRLDRRRLGRRGLGRRPRVRAGRHPDWRDPAARDRANYVFGGAKHNRLFMVASHSLYAVYTATQGASPG
jgi:hypothetical protein